METDLAAERMARIKAAGMDKMRFAWLGETEKGKKHYYRVQGPTFLIEYDNTQNNGNHIHSVWRDFNGDFGRDILREHLKEVAALKFELNFNFQLRLPAKDPSASPDGSFFHVAPLRVLVKVAKRVQDLIEHRQRLVVAFEVA